MNCTLRVTVVFSNPTSQPRVLRQKVANNASVPQNLCLQPRNSLLVVAVVAVVASFLPLALLCTVSTSSLSSFFSFFFAALPVDVIPRYLQQLKCGSTYLFILCINDDSSCSRYQ